MADGFRTVAPKRIRVWHGTRDDLHFLDVERATERGGWAQNGIGLYLTTCLADALSYALPVGFIWECEVDPAICGTTVVEAGAPNYEHSGTEGDDGLKHYVVTETAAVRSVAVMRIEQSPARKLCHMDRIAALKDPGRFGLLISRDRPTPPISKAFGGVIHGSKSHKQHGRML